MKPSHVPTLGVSQNTLEVLGEALLLRRLKLQEVADLLSRRGLYVREEPTGFTFWKGGRRVYGAFSFQRNAEFV